MNEQRKRPPVALMTASASLHAECECLKKMGDAGYEVVIVRDEDLEASLKIVERVRLDTLKEFKDAQPIEETCKWKNLHHGGHNMNPHDGQYYDMHYVSCCPTCGLRIEVVE